MTINEMKDASKNAAKIAAAARAALAKAEKAGLTELVARIAKLDPAADLPAAEVSDLVDWAKELLS